MLDFGMTGRTIATTALLLGASVAFPATASASVTPQNCGTDSFYTVEKVGGAYYKSTGERAGKYNASNSTSTLKYSIKTTTSRSSGWTVGGGLTVKAAIVQIEAKTEYNITKKTSTGVTVTNTINVPGKHYGYTQPKAEFRKFHILKQHYGPSCNVITDKDYGVFAGITTPKFFAECVSKNPCTPKP